VEIRNVLGEKMYCGSGTTINLSEKPKGIYFAEIDFGKTRIIKKISVE
jgi:hypothetical protein